MKLVTFIRNGSKIEEVGVLRGARVLPLRLRRRESLLLFACENEEEWAALPVRWGVPVLAPRFVLEKHEKERFRKIYTASVGAMPEGAVVTVQAEEMAELYVNGRFLGASFWNPHCFEIPGAAIQNGGALRLIVTGSKANQYGNPVPYGLKEEET